MASNSLRMVGVTSANDMKNVYLKDDFLNLTMRLFFQLKISQKLLLSVTLSATLFLFFFASHRKATVREEKVDKVISTARTFVGMEGLQPGDLVFFATGKKKREVTHVGLVTDVKRKNVKFIHASSSLGVVETNLNAEYYLTRFRRARRVIE